MFEFIVILSRYTFIFYIAFFLLQGFNYILAERKIRQIDKFGAVIKQRVVLFLMHLNASMILSYSPKEMAFDKEALFVLSAGFLLFLAMSFLVDKIYKGCCPLINNGVLFLMNVSLIVLFRLSPNLAQRQLIWFFIGFIIMFFVPLVLKIIPRFEKLEIVYYLTGLGLLLATSIVGRKEFGAQRWIAIGSITFQPSEIVKFLFIFYLASVFRKKLSLKQIIIPSILSAVYVLILVYQTDLGSALIFFMTFAVMMYVSTGRELLFFGSMGALTVGSLIAHRIFGHVRVRVDIWRNPWDDPYRTGHQIIQSLFAIGTWGFFGSGLTRGLPNSVPAMARDSIFSAICEELGWGFGMGVVGVYIMIFYRGVNISLRCKRRYYSLLAVGFTGLLAFQTFLIIGGTIKLIPLTGVTLPFISYGGTSIIASTLMIGLLQWIFMYYSEFVED